MSHQELQEQTQGGPAPLPFHPVLSTCGAGGMSYRTLFAMKPCYLLVSFTKIKSKDPSLTGDQEELTHLEQVGVLEGNQQESTELLAHRWASGFLKGQAVDVFSPEGIGALRPAQSCRQSRCTAGNAGAALQLSPSVYARSGLWAKQATFECATSFPFPFFFLKSNQIEKITVMFNQIKIIVPRRRW